MITGAAGGIGQALVRTFCGAGYHVIGVDREPVAAMPSAAEFLCCDLARTVRDAEEGERVLDLICQRVGGHGVRALVNNAAVQILGGVDSLDRAQWATTLEVNLLAPFFWAQGLLPQLQAVQGSVINISSIHARLTKPDFVAYATSKAALSGLTRAMAVDLRGRVRVNAIEPAAIGTAMLKAGFAGQPERFARLEGLHPLGRIGLPEEVAACALELADGASRFLHGACIALDGGIGSCLLDPD